MLLLASNSPFNFSFPIHCELIQIQQGITMFYAVIGLIVLSSIAIALYALIHKSKLVSQISSLQAELEEQESSYASEADRLNNELSKLEKIRHIPNISKVQRRSTLKSGRGSNRRKRRLTRLF